MKDRYIRVGFKDYNGFYTGNYIYKDETKTGLQEGDLVKPKSYLNDNLLDAGKILETDISNERVEEAKRYYDIVSIRYGYRRID